MPRFFLEIAYDGTAYHGWQVQENAHSVQAELNRALEKLCGGLSIETTGCGRTDTGVHATCFFLHFDLPVLPSSPEDFIYRLNTILPKDIAAYRIEALHDSAHARFDASSRTYEYHIHSRKDPFLTRRSWQMTRPLNVPRMNEAAALLLQYSDFATFCKSNSGAQTTFCKVSRAEWTFTADRLLFTITADRFLRNMVRAVVGTLVQVGLDKLSVDDFARIIETRNRAEAGESVPACGLYLTHVTYPYLCTRNYEQR